MKIERGHRVGFHEVSQNGAEKTKTKKPHYYPTVGAAPVISVKHLARHGIIQLEPTLNKPGINKKGRKSALKTEKLALKFILGR
jgi:hypothetical protein